MKFISVQCKGQDDQEELLQAKPNMWYIYMIIVLTCYSIKKIGFVLFLQIKDK